MCAVRIVRPENVLTMPWKNGGGITHEILKREHAGQLLWRLSIAEVASDGPFSVFSGMQRLLTVIEGEGLDLQTPDATIAARLLQPVGFSGDTPMISTRLSTLVKDFNVIFDPLTIQAMVSVERDAKSLLLRAANGVIEAALLLHDGRCDGKILPAHSCVVVELDTVVLSCDGPVIHITLTPQVRS